MRRRSRIDGNLMRARILLCLCVDRENREVSRAVYYWDRGMLLGIEEVRRSFEMK